ncbi:MAG: hypothetical protein HY040_24455 [Planctomycetes bacterium]|nr:hypothetical protein [Planctomycetota bacterium]
MRRLSICTLLALISGCGLSDYEQRLDQERARIKVFDEENKVLGDPIDRPVDVLNKGGKDIMTQVWPFEIFLRVPKEVNNKTEGKVAGFGTDRLKLYRFKGKEAAPKKEPAYSVLVAAAKIEDRSKEGKLKEGLPVKEFHDEVFKALDQYLQATGWKSKLAAPVKLEENRPFSRVEFGRDRSPDVKCDYYACKPLEKDAPRILIFLHQSGARQAAIIYQLPPSDYKADDPRLPEVVAFGLRSLDIGEGATQRRNWYNRYRRYNLGS